MFAQHGQTLTGSSTECVQGVESTQPNARVSVVTWKPVLRVAIPKPDGGKRLLGIPTVVDRVIQQAIAQILSPIYEKQFHPNSYGFRPRRYAEMAILETLNHINNDYQWIVDIDLERFFDTVNHDRLMNLIARTIKDGDIISLIRKYFVQEINQQIRRWEIPIVFH